METVFACPCGCHMPLPDPEPDGLYERVCPDCRSIWQFASPAPHAGAQRFQASLHCEVADGKRFVSVVLVGHHKKTQDIVHKREI